MSRKFAAFFGEKFQDATGVVVISCSLKALGRPAVNDD
jgi:hypothetical protein